MNKATLSIFSEFTLQHVCGGSWKVGNQISKQACSLLHGDNQGRKKTHEEKNMESVEKRIT